MLDDATELRSMEDAYEKLHSKYLRLFDLVDQWENLARRYHKKSNTSEGYAYEHLIASAQTLEMCATHLKIKLNDTQGG